MLTPFLRALRLRCPQCGGRPLFLTWFRTLPSCPVCALQLERKERGYWLGAYFFNLLAVELAFTLWVGGYLIATWPAPDWWFLEVTTFVLVLAVPVLFFPFAKTLFLAFDLLVRPPAEEEFTLPEEPRRAAPRAAP